MKKQLKPLIGLLFISIITGCANFKDLGTPVERKIVENKLYSNKYPKAVISIDENLKYEGEIPHTYWARYNNSNRGSAIEIDKYLFATADENRDISKLLIVSFAKLMSGQWIQGFKEKYSIETGQVKMNGQYFDTALYDFVIKENDIENQYLEAAHYNAPRCAIGKFYAKVYSGRANKDLRLSIIYTEPVDCDDSDMFLPEHRQEQKTKQFIKAFNERADNSFMYEKLI